jgi:glutathione S-transferase
MLRLVQFPGASGYSLSPFCNKVQWALRLKEVPHEIEVVRFAGGRSRTKRLPVLDTGAEVVHDSTEILRWLDEKYPDKPLIPTERAAAAQAYMIEEWADMSFTPLCQWSRRSSPGYPPAFAQVVFPSLPGALGRLLTSRARGHHGNTLTQMGELEPALYRRMFERHADALDVMAEGKEWLVGTAPTIADIGVAAGIYALHFVDCEARGWFEARPNALAWWRRFVARTSTPVPMLPAASH